MSDEARWYVAHTYSGYENKVKANIEKTIKNRNMQDQILSIDIPMADTIVEKNGEKTIVSKKLFPGYVLINMIMNDDTWYVVRNTRGVTSFVGPGSKPVPLTEQEVLSMGIDIYENIDLEVGDFVEVTGDTFTGTVSAIKEISIKKHTVVINVSILGQEVPTELDFSQVKKI